MKLTNDIDARNALIFLDGVLASRVVEADTYKGYLLCYENGTLVRKEGAVVAVIGPTDSTTWNLKEISKFLASR